MMSAIAGVNQALWDIKGKVHDVPIYELLGGKVRDKVQICAGIGGAAQQGGGATGCQNGRGQRSSLRRYLSAY